MTRQQQNTIIYAAAVLLGAASAAIGIGWATALVVLSVGLAFYVALRD